MNSNPKKLTSATALLEANHRGPENVHDNELMLLKLKGDESVDLVLNTSASEFRGKIFAGQTIALGRDTGERLVREDPDSWEVVFDSNPPKSDETTKDRR